MAINIFVTVLAFLITLFIAELLEDIFLINYGGGKFKFRFSLKRLNPFIKKEKALIIWLVQIVIAGILSLPLGKYFEIFIINNIFYYIPILSLSVISIIIIGVKQLGIKMSKNLWWVIVVCIIIFIGSLLILTKGNFKNLKPIQLTSKTPT